MNKHTTATPTLPAVKYLTSTVVKPMPSQSHHTLRRAQETQVPFTSLEQVQKGLTFTQTFAFLFRKITIFKHIFLLLFSRSLCSKQRHRVSSLWGQQCLLVSSNRRRDVHSKSNCRRWTYSHLQFKLFQLMQFHRSPLWANLLCHRSNCGQGLLE